MTEQECQELSLLLEGGMHFREALELVCPLRIQGLVVQMERQLEQGGGLPLLFASFLPKEMQPDYEAMIPVLPLARSLTLAQSLYQSQQESRRQLRQMLGYPCAVLAGSLAGLWVFSQFCFPPLLQMMESFGSEAGAMRSVRQGIGFFLSLILALGMGMIPLGFWLRSKDHQLLGYILLLKAHLGKGLRRWLGLDFSRCFCRCLKAGCATRTTLELLQKLDHKPFIQFMSYHVEQALLAGKSLEAALDNGYLDPSLVRFMRVASRSGNTLAQMENYIGIQERRLQQDSKRMGRILQLCAYGMIALIIILVYQILLLPLSVMSQL